MTVADLIALLQQCQDPSGEVIVRVRIGDGAGHVDITDAVEDERRPAVVIITESRS